MSLKRVRFSHTGPAFVLSPDTQGREASKSMSSSKGRALCPQFMEDMTKNLLTVCKAVALL